jgi:hypothetical protein
MPTMSILARSNGFWARGGFASRPRVWQSAPVEPKDDRPREEPPAVLPGSVVLEPDGRVVPARDALPTASQ